MKSSRRPPLPQRSWGAHDALKGSHIEFIDGTVTCRDGEGRVALCVSGLRWGNTVLRATTHHSEENTLQVVYGGDGEQSTATATYAMSSGVLAVTMDLRVLDHRFWPGNVAILRHFPAAAERVDAPLWLWREDPRGGLPVQHATGRAVQWRDEQGGLLGHELCPGDLLLCTDSESHVPAEVMSTDCRDPRYRIRQTFFLPQLPLAAVSAVAGSEHAAVALTTGRPFHCFQPGEPVSVRVLAWREHPRPGTVSWQIRDCDGVIETEGSLPLKRDGSALTEVELRPGTLGPGPHFASAHCTLHDGASACTDRITISVMSTREQDAKLTPFGLSAARPQAGRSRGYQPHDWLRLMSDLGVTRLRHEFLPPLLARDSRIQQNLHHWQGIDDHRRSDGTLDTHARDKDIASMVADCLRLDAEYDEYANEWNGQGGFRTGHNAQTYVADYLRPYSHALRSSGASTRLCAMGLAGPDVEWLEAFERAGGWPLVDAISLHPGRGNFCPDWAPPPEQWTVSPTGSYWNFLGGLRAVRDLRDEFDHKYGCRTQLLLTEAYAPSFPNSWWEDSPRLAAQNTLLTCALALSEDVEALYWYQLQDGVWFDLDQANHTDREWHFGLVGIDGSLKPAAHAYATATRLLGRAHYRGWLALPDPLRGLGFDTPGGFLQIVWSRAEGYELNADHAQDEVHRTTYQTPTDQGGNTFYPTPEPWIDPWHTATDLTIQTDHGQHNHLDVLGRRRSHPAGPVQLPVTGEPRCLLGAQPVAPLTTTRPSDVPQATTQGRTP